MASTKGDKTYADLIGETPMVRIERALPEAAKSNKVRTLLKLEMQNPGGSIKDRIAKRIIEDAEKEGRLKPGMTVVEYTSGNTGIGMAMISAAKNYPCIIAMPQLPPLQERYIICRQFGAQVHLTAPAKGFNGLVEYIDELKKEPGEKYFFASQFTNESNPTVHYETTGPEIWEQAGKKVDYFVTGVGTGGTAAGVGRFLTEQNPDCKVVCVEPTESRVHIGNPHTPHSILGIGAGVPMHFLKQLEPDAAWKEGPRGHISEFAHCSSGEAVEWATKVTKTEGIMLGPSAGATVKVAMDIAQRPEAAGKTIVVICASHAIRYTKHPLWADVIAEAEEALPNPPNMRKDGDTLLWKSDDYEKGGSHKKQKTGD